MKIVHSCAATVAFVLVAINVIAHSLRMPLLVLNVACGGAFAFFIFSLSPKSPLGFALTDRDWGDIYRREMEGEGNATVAEFRRAAVRSLAILTAVFLLGLCLEFTRRNTGARQFLQSMAILIGMESGFVIGYLVATRHRGSPP